MKVKFSVNLDFKQIQEKRKSNTENFIVEDLILVFSKQILVLNYYAIYIPLATFNKVM